MSEPTTVTTEVEPEPVFVPDYSRVSFKNLQRLCKLRGIPGDGNTVALVEKLRAYDVERGLSCDLSALDDSDPDVDLLGDLDAPVSTEHPHAGPAVLRTPAGGGEAASAPPPAGITAPAPVTTTVATAVAPEVPERVAPLRRGQPNLTVRVGANEQTRTFRAEYLIGAHEVSDVDHARFIAETHERARLAGHITRGGITVGERVGFAADEHGQRTVIYQVMIKRGA